MNYCETATCRLTEPWTNEQFSSLLEGTDLATNQLRSHRSQPQSGNQSRKAWAGNRREYARVGFAVNHACVAPIYVAVRESADPIAPSYDKRKRRQVLKAVKCNFFKFFAVKAFVNRGTRLFS